jgi:hypothetical protein
LAELQDAVNFMFRIKGTRSVVEPPDNGGNNACAGCGCGAPDGAEQRGLSEPAQCALGGPAVWGG